MWLRIFAIAFCKWLFSLKNTDLASMNRTSFFLEDIDGVQYKQGCSSFGPILYMDQRALQGCVV